MAWYKFSVSSNGGKEDTYRWVSDDYGEEDEDEVKVQLDDWASSTAVGQNAENFTVTSTKVKTLPEDVRVKMSDELKSRITKDSHLLDLLREDALRNVEEDKGLDAWAQEVNDAVFRAEATDNQAARAWDTVRQAQQILARFTAPGVAKSAAIEGMKTAQEKAKRRREHR